MINFSKKLEELEDARRQADRPKKNKKIFKIIGFTIIFCVMTLAIFSGGSLLTNSNQDSWVYKIPIIGQLKHLVKSSDKLLKGEDRGRINILLLGMGGKNHDGGYLTDTIMLASLDPLEKKISLLSVPRDLAIPVEGFGWRKINNINAFAEVEKIGSGGLAISQALGDVLNIPIDYFVRIDFDGFINIIDELGGINVYVENTLEDKTYPIMGMEDAYPYESRFEHLYVEEGWQKMDGSLALKYARSRHASGIEGSDFARAKRQQKIIESVKDKILSKNLLFHPGTINNIVNELEEHLSTNLKIWEMIKIWQLFKNVQKENITNKVLDNTTSGLLADSRGDNGAYILVPRSGDFSEIQYFANNIFSDAPMAQKTKIKTENASIDIKNGTWVNGLASKIALDLEKYKFDVVNIGNCSRQNFQKSIIYDLTYGEKIDSLTVLKEKTGANVSFELPQWLINDIQKEIKIKKEIAQPDFILILGQDADKSGSGGNNIE